jgi:hypothetical protein
MRNRAAARSSWLVTDQRNNKARNYQQATGPAVIAPAKIVAARLHGRRDVLNVVPKQMCIWKKRKPSKKAAGGDERARCRLMDYRHDEPHQGQNHCPPDPQPPEIHFHAPLHSVFLQDTHSQPANHRRPITTSCLTVTEALPLIVAPAQAGVQ